jgi:23S rRNA pseudouridine2605 synthase
MMRLNRYLAQCGLGSRRAVEQLILDGKARLNGKPVADLATQVDPDRDRVHVDGRLVHPAARLTYLALNKPKGYDVTRGDPHGHRQVYDLLPRGTHASVKAVGRLDRDSTGLLLFTNDGELAFRLAHPSHGCTKVYQVEVEGRVARADMRLLTEGVQLEDGPARAEQAEWVAGQESFSVLRVAMREGRKRIVRRMCEAIGHPVLALERVAIGPLALGDLKRGQVRPLTAAELAALRRSVGLAVAPETAPESRAAGRHPRPRRAARS